MTDLSFASIDSFRIPRQRSRLQLVYSKALPETPASNASETAAAAGRFAEHCEAEFIQLAEERPLELLRLIATDLAQRPTLLTFAAEAVGRFTSPVLAVTALLPLLGHQDPVVREGAILGLGPHLEHSLSARHALREMVERDPSPGVVAAIEDALRLLD